MKRQRKPKRSNRSDGGRMVKIPSYPPMFNSVPWYNLTVRIAGPAATLNYNTLVLTMSNQLGVSFDGPLSSAAVRFQRIRFWGALSTGVLPPLEVLIFDPLASVGSASNSGGIGPRVLDQFISFPDQVNRTSIGYRYPKAQRETSVLLQNAGSTAPICTATGLGPNSVIYIDLQWRSGNTSPALRSLLQDEEEMQTEHELSC